MLTWKHKVEKAFASANIPQADLVVWPGGQQDILGAGVPQDQTNTSLMSNKIDYTFCHGSKIDK